MTEKIRILIVEDEFMISEDISMRLEDFGYFVAGTASSAEEALELLEDDIIDLALLDVNINGAMDGIELSKIIKEKYQIPFIFLTSLGSKTIVERAKESQPSSFLLKPFNDRQVQIAIDLALSNFSQNMVQDTSNEDIDEQLGHEPILQMLDSLFLKKETYYERVRFKNIQYLTSERNYTVIVTKEEHYLSPYNLKKFETKLPSKYFARVHRSFIININFITGFEANAIFIDKKPIPISKSNKDDIFKILRGG